MTSREFFRSYFLKVLLVLIVVQIGIITLVQNINHKPKAERDEGSVIEGRLLKLNPLSNDTDKDEDSDLSIVSFEQPLNGKVEQKGQLLYYTSNKGFFGLDSLSYRITDGSKKSKPAFISITVIENLPPEAITDSSVLYKGSTLPVDVLANDKDPENDSLFISDFTQPVYGKLTLKNNTFYYTSDNSTAKTDSFQYAVNDGKSTSPKATVYLTIKPKTDAMYPWLFQDVGNTSFKGQTTKSGGRYTLTGSGNDIWYNYDGFYFMYQYLSGDFELSTKVESLDASEDWAKSGIMVRENLSGGSKHLFLALNHKNGAAVYQRQETNGGSSGSDKVREASAPYWLKVKRQGNTFSFSVSDDNIHWNTFNKQEFDMPENAFVGLICCSHNNNEKATAVYSHVKLNN